jgi:hypothetical protein
LKPMIGEEFPPGLRRRTAVPGHVLRDRSLTDADAELQELAVDSRRARQRIRLRHRANQLPNVRLNARPTQAASAPPGPEQPEGSAMPGEDRLRSNDQDGGPPVVPDPRQPHPEHAIRCPRQNSVCACVEPYEMLPFSCPLDATSGGKDKQSAAQGEDDDQAIFSERDARSGNFTQRRARGS